MVIFLFACNKLSLLLFHFSSLLKILSSGLFPLNQVKCLGVSVLTKQMNYHLHDMLLLKVWARSAWKQSTAGWGLTN